MSNQCDIQINPDIIGIGVRISLYILSLAGPILSLFSASDALLRSIETSMGLTGLAVLLTTFVYSGEKTLDLFHALCIFHLVGLAGVSIRPKRDVRQKQITQAIFEVVYLGGTLGLLIFMISVFARAKSFGPKPQCNDGVMYVMFGVNVSAINPTFRALFLANFALMLVGLPVSYLVWSARKERYCSDEEEFAGIRVMSDVAGRCYLIAMLELMIKRNNTTSDGSDWSFGQILAMMMLLGPLIEFVSAFFKDGNQDDDGKKSGKLLSNQFVNVVQVGSSSSN
ncbi:uncharacterized protein BDR25DRAFT_215217 [Lindgomyces ingoldianus]|uniref:Uncharacterized protein n=1 Tax=Lindgomyces ingoldianus TaxID=673940 RepID=A0ACB6R784_9PLEO|nr:uncharacterized protein BDR25DRAFT_215217 [Lindgomyces ingoldianus]KAF2474947.1 hypothetical protein BDR25DRAFT_215217 [Lindgomyces ingoldianus]